MKKAGRFLTMVFLCLSLVYSVLGTDCAKKNEADTVKKPAEDLESVIPFEEALDAAAISQSRIDDASERALILGNGDINALLFSDSGDLVLRLTKNDAYDARHITEIDPPLPTLARIKELAYGDWQDRKWILPEGSDWHGPDGYHSYPYPCPRPCAVVKLVNQPSSSAMLDIRRAAARVTSVSSDAPNTVVRALANKNVFLIESFSEALLLPVIFDAIPAAATGESEGAVWLSQELPGDLDWQGMSFAVALAQDGKRKAVAIVTSHESQDVIADAVKLARSTLEADAAEQIWQHEAEWRRFWAVSGVDIEDDYLCGVWYRNLYFLRCVSKPGVECVGLYAGLVEDGVPAWHGNHTTNYNAEQTFWSSYPTNHTELAEPYERLISGYLPRARWLCRQIFDFDGAYLPHVIFNFEPRHPEKCRSRNGRQFIHHEWGFSIGVAGFTVQNLWLRYKYQPDREYLENTAYPAVRDVAVFFANYINQCEPGKNGKVILAPSVSPEHWGWHHKFERNRNCTFDIAMMKYIFRAAIEGAAALGRNGELTARFKKALDLLPDYPTTKTDSPIVVDVQDAPPINYNIAVPVVPVFPGDVVTWWSSPEEKELFARTIEQIQWNGNNSSMIMSVARARLSLPGTVEWIRNTLKDRQRPNGTLSLNRPGHRFNKNRHYTEQFAASMAVSELLIQSVGDIIRLFPAWLKDKNARFRNLRTQGGFLVSAEQKDGEISSVEITSTVGAQLRLLSPWHTIRVQRGDGKTVTLKPDARGIVELDTRLGERLIFMPD